MTLTTLWFTSLCMMINGVVVDTPVDYLQNFTNGTKAQVEFYTYKQISTYEVYGQWYE